jgi:predicted DNA binding protein
MKKNKSKELIIKELKEMPIVQFVCKKTGLSRASYYRWLKEDKDFAKEAEAAIAEGEALITDMSESQLISLIRDRNFQALQLWLRHHHPKYTNKVEVTGRLNMKEEPLTPEQEELVEKALGLAGVLEIKQTKENDEQNNSKPTGSI